MISRGCPRRCSFCAIGWCQRYIVCPEEIATERILSTEPPVQYVTNSLLDVPYIGKLPQNQRASSMTVAGVNRALDSGSGLPQMARLGVEGVSERLRRAVRKPIKLEDLIRATIDLANFGHDSKLFYIAGLPGETDEDYEEIKEIVRLWTRHTEKHTMFISFTAFVPMAGTPMHHLKQEPGYYDRLIHLIDWYWETYWCPRLTFVKPRMPKNSALQIEAQLHPGFARMVYPHRDRVDAAAEKYEAVIPVA